MNDKLSKQQKQAQFLTKQWMAMETVWEDINQKIEEKARKINTVIKLENLHSLADVMPDDQAKETSLTH